MATSDLEKAETLNDFFIGTFTNEDIYNIPDTVPDGDHLSRIHHDYEKGSKNPYTKIAPIFLRAMQYGKHKQRSDGEQERMQKSDNLKLITPHIQVQNGCESAVQPVEKQNRSKRLSRTHRLKQRSRTPPGQEEKLTKPDTQSPKSNSSYGDILWTDKYSPQHSSEVIGNVASVKTLQSWLKKWKLRADKDERRKMEERKREENSNGSWDCGDFQGEAGSDDGGEETLCNAMLITGPSGVGKTASVYACAQELGFKIFEVNSSSQRSGRHVLAQLKEATQSHLVETTGTDPLKPAYFNNYSSRTLRPENLPGRTGKTVFSENISFTSKKQLAQRSSVSGRKVKSKAAAVSLTRYFKMKAKGDHLRTDGLSPSEKSGSKSVCNLSSEPDQTVHQSKKAATSLILFEEVDIIFDDDVGFLSAIKAFMTTTKRPVILTVNDPRFKERFDFRLEEITFRTLPTVNVCSYLQLVCLAEKVRLDLEDVRSLLGLTHGDVRHCLLQLQFWVHSSGRSGSQSEDLSKERSCEQDLNAAEETNTEFPPCGVGCSANMLGLPHMSPNHLVTLSQSWSERNMNELLRLLAECWRRGVPLLYCNLEILLSKGATGTSVYHLDKANYLPLQHHPVPESNQHQNQNFISELPTRTISRLSRRRRNTAASSSSNLNFKCQSSLLLNGTRLSDTNEQTATKVVKDCLDALADFFDLMSYLDATLPAAGLHGSCTSLPFVWTGAEFRDGLLDESSQEDCVSPGQERLVDIQAAVEALGCHRCWWKVSEACRKVQKCRRVMEERVWESLVEGLQFTDSSENVSFSFQPLCSPSVSQRRYKLSRSVLTSKPFRLMGNRQAVSVDYMPTLRSICRAHRDQQLKEGSGSCQNYLSSIHLGLPKSSLQLLSEDFTERKLKKTS
ncbi:ATPase family AAA domain-containing protein 5b [Pholidichthys leucotaenia]